MLRKSLKVLGMSEEKPNEIDFKEVIKENFIDFAISDPSKIFALVKIHFIDKEKLEKLESREIDLRGLKKIEKAIELTKLSQHLKERYGYYFDSELLLRILEGLVRANLFEERFKVYYFKTMCPLIIIPNGWDGDENVLILAPRLEEEG